MQKLDVKPCVFLKTDLFDMDAVSKLPVSNPQVIVLDCPWECIFLASDHHENTYKLASSTKLLQLFHQIRTWFTPRKGQVGHIFIWFTNDKLELAMQCLAAAGYKYIGINSWHKATQEDVPYKLSPYRGNVEMFLVGEKRTPGTESLCKTQRGFCAPPYVSMHSSKPLEFYTEFLPFFARNNLYGKPWSKVEKVDLFTRHSQDGFLSVGNEFVGRRELVYATPTPRTQMRLKRRRPLKKPVLKDAVPAKKRARGIGQAVFVRRDDREFGAVITSETDRQFLIEWDDTSKFQWVDKHLVMRKRKYT